MAQQPVYSTQFICGEVRASGGVTNRTYTVPAGYRAVLKCATACQRTAGTSQATLNLIRPGSGLSATLWSPAWTGTTALQSAIQNELMVVAEAGETFNWAIFTLDMYVTASGFLLTM